LRWLSTTTRRRSRSIRCWSFRRILAVLRQKARRAVSTRRSGFCLHRGRQPSSSGSGPQSIPADHGARHESGGIQADARWPQDSLLRLCWQWKLDQATGLALDANGSPVITGNTRNANFPLKNAFQTQFKAIYGSAFISKLSPDGKSLVSSSYIGGSNYEWGGGIALDPQGNALITGQTYSNDFPVKQAFQKSYGGAGDCYAAKIAPNGDLLWSTYLGGTGGDFCYGIAADQQGNAYIAGSSNFVRLSFEKRDSEYDYAAKWLDNSSLIKLSADGSITTATFLGGPVAGAATCIDLDQAGDVYLGGWADSNLATKNAFQADSLGSGSGFVLEVDNSLRSTIFATYLGGSSDRGVSRLALDKSGSLYVSGSTSSPDFPLKFSFQSFIGGGVCQCDAFLAKFAPGAQSLIYSTLMGGHNGDSGGSVAVDGSGVPIGLDIRFLTTFRLRNAFQSSTAAVATFFRKDQRQHSRLLHRR